MKHTFITRRDFVRQIASGVTATAFGPWLSALHVHRAFGQTQAATAGPLSIDASKPRYLITVFLEGGWDTTLASDAVSHERDTTQDSDVYLAYSPAAILRPTAHLALGPAMEPLIPLSSNMITVNGINMRIDNGHQSMTATMKAGHKGSGPEMLAHWQKDIDHRQNLGLIAIGGRIESGELNVETHDPLLLVRPQAESLFLNNLTLQPNKSQFGFLEQSAQGIARIERLKNERLKATVTCYRNSAASLNPHSQHEQAFEVRSRIAVDVLKQDLVSGISIHFDETSDGGTLDTHSNHTGLHLPRLLGRMQKVAMFIDLFQKTESSVAPGKSLFDLSLILVTSEMSRTPFLNGGNGKDHNPFANSALILGGQLEGGFSVGATRVIPRSGSLPAEHVGLPMDMQTGEIIRPDSPVAHAESEFVQNIFPENLTNTVLDLLGAGADKLRRATLGYHSLPNDRIRNRLKYG